MAENVLFVCAQNVCRSPLMAAVFEEALRAEGELGMGSPEWIVESVGAQATDGKRACGIASEIAPEAAGHHSVRVSADDIDLADLVIAASLEERSAIASLRPDARARTFTLREALLLGESAVEAESLAEYAETLNSRRGTLDLPAPSRRRWLRQPSSPLDVVDVHHFGVRAHRRGLEKAAADTRLLASRLRRQLASDS